MFIHDLYKNDLRILFYQENRNEGYSNYEFITISLFISVFNSNKKSSNRKITAGIS